MKREAVCNHPLLDGPDEELDVGDCDCEGLSEDQPRRRKKRPKVPAMSHKHGPGVLQGVDVSEVRLPKAVGGRPRKPEGEKLSVGFYFRTVPAEAEILFSLARKAGISGNLYVQRVIRAFLRNAIPGNPTEK